MVVTSPSDAVPSEAPGDTAVPVVLLHGWGGSFAETWHEPGIDALITDLGRRVVGVDLLGHGEAPKPHEPEAYADLSGWLLERLDAVAPVVDVVAFSLGAMTALGALARRPERFGRVVLAGIGDGTFQPRNEDQHRRILAALESTESRHAAGGADDTAGEETVDTIGLLFAQYAHRPGNDPVALAAIMRRPEPPTLSPSDLAGIGNQVLVVIGDRDFAAPAAGLAGAFANGRLVTLRNTDHFATPGSFPFIDAVLDFLSTPGGAPDPR